MFVCKYGRGDSDIWHCLIEMCVCLEKQIECYVFFLLLLNYGSECTFNLLKELATLFLAREY